MPVHKCIPVILEFPDDDSPNIDIFSIRDVNFDVKLADLEEFNILEEVLISAIPISKVSIIVINIV